MCQHELVRAVICKSLKFKNQVKLLREESLLQSLGESLLAVSLGETDG